MFEWDAAKSEANLLNRGFDFAHAAGIFDGPILEVDDSRADYGERRVLAIGKTGPDFLLVRLHVARGGAADHLGAIGQPEGA